MPQRGGRGSRSRCEGRVSVRVRVRVGGLEGWRIGGLEDWRVGGLED